MEKSILEKLSVLKVKDSGFEFNVKDNVWVLSKDIKLNLLYLENTINLSLLSLVKETLAYTAVHFSSAYTRKFYFAIKKLIVFNNGELKEFECGLLKRFYNTFLKINYTHVESMKYFLIKFHELHNKVLKQEVIDLISKWKVAKPRTTTAYNERQKYLRPLLDNEMKHLIFSITKEYNEGNITMNDYLLVMLLIYTGRRPMQIAQLKRKDLYIKNEGNYLNIPRLKQGGKFRTDFTELKISDNLFDSLSELKAIVKAFAQNEAQDKLSKEELDNLPLFIDPSFFNSGYKINEFYENNFVNLHMSSKTITSRLQSVHRRVSGNKNSTINSRQLRITLATRLAQRGYGLSTLAKVLDHTNLKSVLSYAKNNEEFSFRIEQAINESISPYASSFLMDSEGITFKMIEDLINIKKLTNQLISNHSKQSEVELLVALFAGVESKINTIIKFLNTEEE
ncbi:site-specific integrase [Cronobacter malonaticus]|uniref:site-specific integrase n=1 Tax=Cronobacter malonaticus TaxID=413503 RepID=UPI001375C5E2|nr:site-specific integrase [Cronobacter malonaticus]NCH84216.1 site-specific integrase [Cronobacter malonaticus]